MIEANDGHTLTVYYLRKSLIFGSFFPNWNDKSKPIISILINFGYLNNVVYIDFVNTSIFSGYYFRFNLNLFIMTLTHHQKRIYFSCSFSYIRISQNKQHPMPALIYAQRNVCSLINLFQMITENHTHLPNRTRIHRTFN